MIRENENKIFLHKTFRAITLTILIFIILFIGMIILVPSLVIVVIGKLISLI